MAPMRLQPESETGMIVIGIDPGLHGAVATFDGDRLLTVVDMPVLAGEVDTRELASIIRSEHDTTAVLEWPGIMPRNGAKSARSIGFQLGQIITVLAYENVPCHQYAPGVWKRGLNLNGDKAASRKMAMRLWPCHAGQFQRVKDDGRAEAALIAHWWMTKGRGHAQP